MKELEFLRKISFREGFFSVVMLVAVVLYINSFVQAPTERTLAKNIFVIICFWALCLLTDLLKFPSKQRAERMLNLASLWLFLSLFVTLTMAICYAFAAKIVFSWKFLDILSGFFLMYCLLGTICGAVHFQYRNPQKEVTVGVREVKNQ